MKNKVSVVITTYRDRGHLFEIIDTWLSENINVYVADGSRDGIGSMHLKTTSQYHHYHYYPDPGNKIRFATAQLTTTPYVILADDDFMPKPGLIEDFFSYNKYGFMGLIGKKPDSPHYRKCSFYRADKIKEPVRTFFVGVCYFVNRELLQFDYSGLKNRAVDDLYWQLHKFPTVPKHVIPTKNYENLFPDCSDKESIFKTPESKEYREHYYADWYRRNDPTTILLNRKK